MDSASIQAPPSFIANFTFSSFSSFAWWFVASCLHLHTSSTFQLEALHGSSNVVLCARGLPHSFMTFSRLRIIMIQYCISSGLSLASRNLLSPFLEIFMHIGVLVLLDQCFRLQNNACIHSTYCQSSTVIYAVRIVAWRRKWTEIVRHVVYNS